MWCSKGTVWTSLIIWIEWIKGISFIFCKSMKTKHVLARCALPIIAKSHWMPHLKCQVPSKLHLCADPRQFRWLSPPIFTPAPTLPLHKPFSYISKICPYSLHNYICKRSLMHDIGIAQRMSCFIWYSQSLYYSVTIWLLILIIYINTCLHNI